LYRNYIEELNLKPDEIIDYLRKSRADDPTLTVEEVLARHEAILDEWVEKNLGEPIPETNKYREVVSGETIADRPEMLKVLKLIESPKIKAILVVEVQRLSRGDLEDCGRLIKILRYTNTLVITPHKIYDLRDEYDRDMFERELKRGNDYLEYTKKIMQRGTLRSVSEGNYVGSVPPYGYDKAWIIEGKRKCPTLAINEEQANVVRMIFDLYVNKDMGMPNIAKHLDSLGIAPPRGERWSAASIKDILINIHYLGKVKWNWRKTVTIIENGEVVETRPKSQIGEYLVYDGKHEAIISEDLFNAAQEKQGRNHRTKGTTKVRNPLASLVYCQCGKAMTYRTYKSHNGVPRLVCTNHSHCHTSSCTYEELEQLVVDILRKCIADYDFRLKSNQGDSMKLHEKLLKSLEKKMQDLEAKELAQWEAQAHPDESQRMPPHIFKMLNEKLLKEKDEVKEAMCNARKSMPDPVDYEEKRQRFSDALNALLDPEVDAEQKNRLLKACIDRITYNRAASYRAKSQQVKFYDKEIKRNRSKSPLKTGGNWVSAPIELDVKLKV
jgi:hypothetical protein